MGHGGEDLAAFPWGKLRFLLPVVWLKLVSPRDCYNAWRGAGTTLARGRHEAGPFTLLHGSCNEHFDRCAGL